MPVARPASGRSSNLYTMAAIGIGIGAVGALALFWLVVARPPQRPLAATPSSRPEVPASAPTDRDILVRETKNEAVYAAKLIIQKRLKAPSQAKFIEKTLIAQMDNFALVYLTVDAPNSYGVMLRNSYCVVVSFTPPRGDNYQWNNVTGVVGCKEPPDADTQWSIKAANGWPRFDEEPVPESFKKAQQRGRRRN